MIRPIYTIMLATLVTPSGAAGSALQGPKIELWTDRSDATVYRRGDHVRVYFRSDEDAYVTILRVDTDGRVRVLFPEEPWDDNFARGGRAYEVRPGDQRYAFNLDEYPGQGYVFAIATLDPFDYRGVVRGDHWDYRAIASGGRVTGDPYVAVQDLVDVIVPANYDAYSYDVATYYVEQYYEYPRFLCYDCHSYVAYPYWDPYHYSCIRFRIVAYDDPYYYPARVYAANRVVYRRVARIEPRYVFKDRTATDAYVVRVRQRPAEPESRRVEDRGATSRDVGGVGTIPAPVRDPAGRVPAQKGTQGVGPARRPDPTGALVPQGPGQVPDRRTVSEPAAGAMPQTTDRPRTPGGITVPSRDPRTTPQGLAPRTVEPREPTRTPERERPTLERRVPPNPDQKPAARPEPQRAPATPQARPPAVQPKVPVKKPDPPQKKPDVTPPRRKPGG